MRLELDHISGWRREDAGPARVYAVPGFVFLPDLWFEVFPIVGRNQQPLEPVLLHGVEAGSDVRRAPVTTVQTKTGWVAAIHEVAIHGPGGELREQRMLARYELLVLAGFVLVRATSAERYAAHRADILEVLASARAELSGDEPATISELWKM
jgi:hypothetical protein